MDSRVPRYRTREVAGSSTPSSIRARCHAGLRDDGEVRPWIYGGFGVAAAWCAPAPAPVIRLVAQSLRIPVRIRSDSCVALTFDDGPHPQGTTAALEVLADAGATATFFLIGEQVERWPAVAAEIAVAGHEIALHGYRHRL